jgi:hypothetical protein
MNFKLLFSIIFITMSVGMNAQNVSIQGKISDATTRETLVGCAIMIQGSTIGTITDFDGNYSFVNVAPGDYNLVVSYVSYEQQIIRVQVIKGQPTTLDIQMKPSTVQLEDVKVVATKRTNTELSMITSIRSSLVVASGISSQQIVKSQDKDASEVIRRVPGISIREGRFVVVRGLSERYNSVWLNNAAAPSSETDVRAFSFDMVPSSQLENLLIVKSPAPELPADFAGGAIQIATKNNAYENAVHLSYTIGYNANATFNKFYTYKGGKTDWLGYDDGTRDLPDGFPSTKEVRDLYNNSTDEQKAEAVRLSRSFNKTWEPYTKTALPDQALAFDLSKRFLLGTISVGNITALTYNNSNSSDEMLRAGYQQYDAINNRPSPLYYFNDQVYSNSVRIGGMSNWSFIFGNNQKIQFRNLLNQFGQSTTTLRDGIDSYNNRDIIGHELAYQSRTTYAGQLAGDHAFFNSSIKADWVLGYSYANKKQPDIRRTESSRSHDFPENKYQTVIQSNANPNFLGRIHMNNHENIWTAGFNITGEKAFGSFKPQVKTGFYSEFKSRNFSARNIGFIQALHYNSKLALLPLDSLFMDENLNYPDGITVSDATNLSDSYTASNKLIASYLGLKIPFWKFSLYGGFRIEKNQQLLDGYNQAGKPVHIDNDTLILFPSVNLSYNINEKIVARFAYGKTINRPEFREIAPFTFYNFEENAIIMGDSTIKSCFIDNYDLKLEWYPQSGDVVSVSAFYKKFSNPIEAALTNAGTGWNYIYANVEQATSKGIEFDARKSLEFIPASNFLTSLFHYTTLVFNTSVIHSGIKTNDPKSRDSIRPMQGQAPFIVNAGIYYSNPSGLSVSILYNVVGKNISFVGDEYYAHIYQMPFNDLQVLVQKEITENWKVKLGAKNLLNNTNTRQNLNGDHDVKENQITHQYKPGRTFNIGLTYTF